MSKKNRLFNNTLKNKNRKIIIVMTQLLERIRDSLRYWRILLKINLLKVKIKI